VRRRALKFLVALLATIIPLGITAVPAHADSVADQFLAKINGLRASKGLQTLHVDGALTSFAQGWSDHMGAVTTLSHNPALSSSPGDWTKAGENVGVGPTVKDVQDAFMQSPGHRQNVLFANYNIVGVGVAVGSDGSVFVAHEFAQVPASQPSHAVAAAPAPVVHHVAPATQKVSAPAVAPKATAKVAPVVETPAPANHSIRRRLKKLRRSASSSRRYGSSASYPFGTLK